MGGRKYLLITGVLFAIYGIVLLLRPVTVLVQDFVIWYLFEAILATYSISIGIIGIICRDDMFKADLLIGLGIAHPIMTMLLFAFVGGSFGVVLLTMPIPIFYVIGAFKNR